MFRLLCKLLSALLLLVLMAAGHAAPPPAGTVIRNTATGTYVDSASGLAGRLTSNTVSTTVSPLEALTLTNSQNLLIATAAPFAISHTLTNTGNIATSYALNAVTGSGGSFVPVNLQVVQDVNANGRADAGEPVVAPGGTINLAPGASAALVITGQVPASAVPGQTGQIVLTATSTVQGATASNTDTLNLTNGAAVQTTLAASTPNAAPGVPFSLTATAVNNGNAPAGAVSVTVDGAPANLFLLRVPVPLNTTLVAAQPSTNAGARTLYHLTGAPANSYVTAVPASATVDAVAWGIASLPTGGSLQGQLGVVPNGNASGTLSAIAYSDWNQLGANFTTPSNTVLLPLPARAATIHFYPPTGYTTPATQSTLGNPLFVQVDAAVCNADPAIAGTVPVTLTSQLTGDTETFIAVETGPNTGLFRIQPNVPTANAATRVVAAGNGVLEVLRNDTVSASITSCGGITVTATTALLIDPSGVVYDSRTNQPVAGATVRLIDVTGAGNGGNPGGPAAVLQGDGVSPAPNTVVTGADGSYAFPLVAPSTYRLLVTPPAGYTFVSTTPPGQQPAGRFVDGQGSYGGTFTVGGAGGSSGAIRLDIPVDPSASGSLFIQKTANKATAEIGDFIDYSIRFNNTGAVALPGTVVSDRLPAGFAYVRGSARFNNAPLADPAGGAGPRLQFTVGSVATGSQPVLSYRVRVGAGSLGGNGTNTAEAASGAVRSNSSSVRVQVAGGVFSSKAYLIGKVFADCRRDGVQDAGDPGVPGVRIFLENGTYAVTDEEGKYSFYGLEPRTHVAKVDNTTLPAGASLQVLGNRNAFDAGSRFVDLTNGELGKADFAVADCTPALREQIEARRKALVSPSEILQAAGNQLPTDRAAVPVDARTLPSSGVLGLPGAVRGSTSSSVLAPNAASLPGLVSPVPGTLGAVGDPGGAYAPNAQGVARPLFVPGARLPDAIPAQPSQAAAPADNADKPSRPLEDLLADLNAEVGFIGLSNDEVMRAAQTPVRVKGPIGATFELSVNGQVIPATQVGKRSSLEKNAVAAWEFIGVDLKPGRNTLAVRALDGFGIVRGSAQIEVRAPGQLARIEITAPTDPVADAASAVAINIALRDADGVPVAGRTQVTLQASLGQWQTPDLDSRQPGTQVFIEGGEGRFLLLPPAQPGKAEITALAGTARGSSTVTFTPNLRPMIAAGIVEGTLNLRNLNPKALQPEQSGDVFERQIQTASRSFDNGKGEAAARTALFLKGKVLGSSLLTLSYDSDKPADTALFRDIQPNQFYPVYGDSGARGFDAQSTGRLFVLLQNGTNYALLGDYSTQSDNPARQLTQYSRALNGVKGRLQEGVVTAEGFASRTSTTQVVQEFRANGTSGPFRLNLNGVVNSQQINVLTRSRNQPSVIVNDVALSQFTDYEIEPFTGLLLLKSPVPSVDSDLNPVFIRVSYAVDTGGPKHSVGGIEARVAITPDITLGAVAVRDDDPANKQNLSGLNIAARLGDKTVASGEVARSSTDLQGSGSGQRFEIRHDGNALQARAWGARTDGGFYNIGSPQSAGQQEYGAKLAYPLDEKNRLVGEALRTANSVTGAEQTGMELKLEHSLQGNMKLEIGLRRSSANAYAVLSTPALPGSLQPVVPSISGLAANPANGEQAGYTSARVKLTVPVPNVPQAEVFGVAEYAVDGSDGRQVGVGGNYAINPTTKLYARHDFINSLNGPYTLSPAVAQYTTVAGINTELTDSTQLFNEYRVGDSIDGRSSEAAVGLRRQARLENGIGLSASVQRIKPVSGAVLDDSSAIALGADYIAAANWKASGQVQWQTSISSRSWLVSAALANKLDENWTLLNRGLYSIQTSIGSGSGERELITAQSGFAYRPTGTNVWNALGRVEYRHDADSTLGAGLNRDQSSWIVSSHINVQPSRAWLMTGRYAARWADDRANSIASSSFTQLIGARSTWDVTDRWDVGAQAYRMWGNNQAEHAVGVEVGYLAVKNLWLSLGYNIKGFNAPELAGEAYTRRGLYVRMRFKFDETLLGTEAAVTPVAPVGSAVPAGGVASVSSTGAKP
jgi:uncharacterized repeat protein (TIGR01451 family)